MSDELNDAVETATVVEESQPEQSVDYDSQFMELAASGDFEAFAELEKELASKKQPTEVSTQESTVEETPSSSEPVEDDKDGEEETTTTEEVKEEEVKIDPVETLKQQLIERDRKLAEMAKVVNSTVQQPAAQQVSGQQAASVGVSLPDFPSRPEGVSFDPADWSKEDIEKMAAYSSEMEQYNTAQNEALKLLVGGDNSFVNRLNAIEQRYAAEAEKHQREMAERNFWDSIKSFQSDSKEFKTSRDISEIHKELDTIGEMLTKAAGYYPNYQSQEAMRQYEQNKGYILGKYLEGDPEVAKLAASLGVKKPEDTDKYMRIKEVIDYRDTAVQTGRLGANAPLQTAYLDMLATSGELNKLMESMVLDERSKAYKDKAEAIKEASQVVKTPSNAGIGGVSTNNKQQALGGIADILSSQGLSNEEIEFFNNVNEHPELLQEQGNLERFAALDKKLNL